MAHWRIRQTRPRLPSMAELTSPQDGEAPVRLSYINTATQKMARKMVLAPGQDPRPQAAYVMSHPSFVLESEDGRILLVDVGMTRDGALSFGKPMESLGADPIQPLTSAAEGLGAACVRVAGIVFTHLHSDHVGGITELCKCAGHKIPVYMSAAQATITNHTTGGGLELLRASSCVEIRELEGGPIWDLSDFPGTRLVHAGGHTPGSQVVLTRVHGAGGDQHVVFVGDLVNNIDGIEHDVPKPFLYSLLLVPEDRTQLSGWRQLLRQLGQSGHTLLVAHDQLAMEGAGLTAFARTHH